MISALYGQRRPVNASAPEHAPFEHREVGPTITGIAHARTLSGDRLTLEELAIPGALRRLFEEVITTAALPVKLGRADWSTHAPREPDSAAVDREAIGSTQIFAAFGDDGARGTLAMANGWEAFDWDGAITATWPGAGSERVYALQDRLLGIDCGSGGLYLRSPLWQPLPEELSAALSGPKAERNLLTVHPLGGCPMGSDRDAGVVDDIGRVFDLEGGATTYEGLLVLDGSIIPTALGTNPLLTIAALAERAVARYADTQDWDLRLDRDYPHPLPGGVSRLAPQQPAEARTEIRFAERMKGPLELPGAASPRVSCVLETEFEPFEPRELLRGSDHRVRIASATLTARDASAGVSGEVASAAVSGDVYWLELGRTSALGRVKRALCTWARTRALADLCQRIREEGWRGLIRTIVRGGSIVQLATNLGEVRYLRYELDLDEDLRGKDHRVLLPRGTHITGLKTFQYALGGNPWRQLSEMPVTIALPGQAARAAGKLRIDPLHLLRRYAMQLQTVAQADAPNALVDLASVALYMVRLIFKIHFWSFRLPEYERRDPRRAERRLPGELSGFVRRVYSVQVPVDERASTLALPITNYRREGFAPDPSQPPVVLFHGFGSSGVQFAFPPAGLPRKNLVIHLAAQGYDVWVPELRTSIGVPSSRSEWTLDEVAKNDIPSVVDLVLRETGARQVDVVAHCIGSAMFCTAALAERVEARGRTAGRPGARAEQDPARRAAAGRSARHALRGEPVQRAARHLPAPLRRGRPRRQLDRGGARRLGGRARRPGAEHLSLPGGGSRASPPVPAVRLAHAHRQLQPVGGRVRAAVRARQRRPADARCARQPPRPHQPQDLRADLAVRVPAAADRLRCDQRLRDAGERPGPLPLPGPVPARLAERGLLPPDGAPVLRPAPGGQPGVGRRAAVPARLRPSRSADREEGGRGGLSEDLGVSPAGAWARRPHGARCARRVRARQRRRARGGRSSGRCSAGHGGTGRRADGWRASGAAPTTSTPTRRT